MCEAGVGVYLDDFVWVVVPVCVNSVFILAQVSYNLGTAIYLSEIYEAPSGWGLNRPESSLGEA